MEIKCRFYTHEGKHVKLLHAYACEAKEIVTTSMSQEVTFTGTHQPGKTNADIVWLTFFNKPMPFIPKNLMETFPNLRCLTMRCGLEKITKEDLKGLESLEYLDLDSNKFTSLPDDLFADMKNLRWIYFQKNQIERLSSKILQPIYFNLDYVDFSGNKKIDALYSDKVENKNDMREFMRIIDSSCLPPESEAEIVFAEFAKFRISGDFTDFTIKAFGQEFKVHKMILAAQSPVFKEMFADDTEELTMTLHKIKEFDSSTFKSFLDYFYTGEVGDDINFTKMLDLASTFDVPKLKNICTSRIVMNVNYLNAVQIFNLGHLHNCEVLKKKSFEYIKGLLPGLHSVFVNKPEEVNRLIALKNEMDEIMRNIN